MKTSKKLIALLIAMIMVMTVSISAFAASITITRDDSYEEGATGDGRTYSYYKVFSASYATDFEQDFEGGHNDGVPETDQGDEKVAYTATAAVAAKLLAENSGNEWFDATAIPGDASKYVITWKTGVTANAATMQAAAAWLIANQAFETGPVAMSFSDGQWTATDIEPGYYVVSGDTGNNLIAVTSDIEIKEKNDYPQIDKTQADEDNTTQSDTKLNLAVGDIVTYQAKVTIPYAAKVGDKLVAVDTPSVGLTYNNDVEVISNEGGATVAYGTPAGSAVWTATITVVDGSQGKDVIFEYTMTINEDALVDTGRINTLELTYGDKYTAKPITVPYTTYFAGIEKVDGDNNTVKLEGVEFMLKEGDVEFKVSKADDGYYYYDADGSSTVKTDADGKIVIRGLDSDKTYTLTETLNPIPGYNMLSDPVTLTLAEDTGDAYTTATFDQVVNNQGTILPSTGGIGTTIFYVVGVVLVLGAAVILVTRRHMSVN